MKLKGQIQRVTDLNQFVGSYLKTSGKPTAGFEAWGKARVHLVVKLGAQFPVGFIPTPSIKVDADSQGRFTVTVPDNLSKFEAYVVAYTQVTTVNVPVINQQIPIFGVIYRSEKFKLSNTDANSRNIFVYATSMPDSQGIAQAELDKEAAALKKSLKLDSASARISASDVDVTAKRQGATIKFDAKVTGATSEDLNELIRVKAENIDIDLPGPDWIVGICVDEDDIERQIRSGVSNLGKTFNSRIREQLLKSVPGGESLASLVSVSIRHFRFPVTSTQQVKVPVVNTTITIQNRSVVGDPCIGVPRKLY